MLPRRRLLAIVLPVALAGVVAFVVWPRGARLKWYTSPPVTVRGTTARVRLLVPEDWTVSMPAGVVNGKGAWDLISLRPKERLLERIFQGGNEPTASLTLVLSFRPGVNERFDGRVLKSERRFPTGIVYAAERTLDLPPAYRVTYSRSNRHEFAATYRRICESFQVIRQ